VEFHDYFEWAADRLSSLVAYGREVTAVEPVLDDGAVVAFDVHAGGARHRAANVVVAAGLEPRLPDGVTQGQRVWHRPGLLPGLAGRDAGGAPARLGVGGGGQRGAAVTALLHDRFPRAEVHAVVSRFGYAPADDSPFANRIFDPASVDLYHQAPDPVKRMLLDDHRNTNYSVVDQDLIVDLYRRTYRESAVGRQRLEVHNLSRVQEVTHRPGGADVSLTHLPTGEWCTLRADLVVLATGYRPADPLRLLGPAADLCRRDAEGRIRIGRDCRLELSAPGPAALFVQGAAEHAHGLSSTLLSMVAVRAGWIADALAERAEGWRRPAVAAGPTPPGAGPGAGHNAPAPSPVESIQ
jgi:L-ornithine N5-oxygenase